MGEEANSGGVMLYGTYNGIPIFVAQYMEPGKIMAMKNTDAKPSRKTRVKEPRTKGLLSNRVTAYIVHPSVADKIKELL
jgi:hypothetical protein